MDYKAFLKKHSLKELDWVFVETGSETLEGKILPSTTPGILSLKLKTGYNVGISLEKIKTAKKASEREKKEPVPFPPLEKKSGLPTISILHTGGTIASKIDYETGGVKASISPESLAKMVPELSDLANFDYKLLANIMSEDLRFSHSQLIVKTIAKELGKVDGIIVTQGTDTLGYNAAVLAFMLQDIPIPVVLTGSQRSSDRGGSDASSNLLCAAAFIAKTDFAGVAVCMHETTSDNACVILPATRTRKLHTSRRDAFKAVNSQPIARVSYPDLGVRMLETDYAKRGVGKFKLLEEMEDKVALVKTHPNMSTKTFEFFFDHKNFKGIVLEATGIGQAPTNIPEHEKNYSLMKKFISDGGIVGLTSQCVYGRVHPFIYANCRRLFDIGVLFSEDMLSETAFVKLSWLLGNYKKSEEVKTLYLKNLRGELSEKTRIDSSIKE